jgi:uncharacterized damage-inducible protein DinB
VLLKCEGLTAEQLGRAAVPTSSLTLGGLLHHLALVEDSWFRVRFLGEEHVPPWVTVDWDADPDWDWHSAVDDTPEQVRELFDEAVARADKAIDEALARPTGLGTPSARPSRRSGNPYSLRWILLHMVEEYARHNGHADLIRESIDGQTGD